MHTLISHLIAAKHRLDEKIKNTQPGATAALVSIHILCLYFIQHLTPHVYSSQVLTTLLSATIRLWDKQLISRHTKQHEGRTAGGRTAVTLSPIPGEHSAHHTSITTSPEIHQQGGNPNTPVTDTNPPPSGYQIQHLPNNHYHLKPAKRISQSRAAQKN